MEWKKLFKIVIAFILMLIYNNYYSQNYRAFYTIKYKTDSTENKTENKNMLLDIKGSISRFYSYKLYKSDSTLLANEKIGRETPTKSMDYDFMVIKKKDQNQIEKFYRLQMDIYLLKEQSPKFDWKVTNEIRRIGEFTCQKATTKFKGRIWEAWFTQEIPINEGPYIFNGLPGLIISVYDAKDNYHFDLIGLKKNFDDIYTENNNSLKTIPVNLKQLNKVFTDYYNDPYKEVKSGYLKMKFVDESGKEITPNYNELTKAKQEIIRKNNNPIELSEAIRYLFIM